MSAEKKQPLRKCVGCGNSKDKKDLIRILKTPEGQIILDATGRQNGRGAYICKDLECLKKAIKNKGLERSFKQSIEKEVYDALKKEFESLEK